MISWSLFSPPPPPPPPPPTFDVNTLIGISLALLAAAMNAVGVNLQRLGKRRGSATLSAAGVALATMCGAADMASFSFAPQSLLAPFASVGLVINLLLAPLMHSESVSMLDMLCTSMVMGGVAVCLATAATETPLRTVDELAALATRPQFLAWLGVEAAVLAIASLRAKRGPTKSMATAVSYAVCAGVFGGFTVLNAKILTECTRAGCAASTLMAVAAAAGMCGVAQVTTLNTSVGIYSPLLVVPIFTATSLATNASGGGIFFEEYAAFSERQLRVYPAGVALLLTGVLLLASKAPTPSSEAKKSA